MSVVWSPLALARLREATDFIARDKPGAAERGDGHVAVDSNPELLGEGPGWG